MPVLALCLFLLGLVGLILPVLPGIPLLVVAALIFTAGRPGLRRRLKASRLGAPLRRADDWRAKPGEDGLAPFDRAKLRALRGLARVLPKRTR